MFRRRRKGALSRAMGRTGDTELRILQDQVAARQEQIAEFELELFDMRADLERFRREKDRRAGLLQRRLVELQAEVEAARRRSAFRAQWKKSREPPEFDQDVSEQFRRAWTPRDVPPEPPRVKRSKADEEIIKTLFRTLAKRFHPDLTIDPDEKAWRQNKMAEVNQAYAERDLQKLEGFSNQPERQIQQPERSRDQMLVDLRREVHRLDGLILDLKRQLTELNNSPDLQLMLKVSLARHEGWDLLANMAAEVQAKITQLEAELATIG